MSRVILHIILPRSNSPIPLATNRNTTYRRSTILSLSRSWNNNTTIQEVDSDLTCVTRLYLDYSNYSNCLAVSGELFPEVNRKRVNKQWQLIRKVVIKPVKSNLVSQVWHRGRRWMRPTPPPPIINCRLVLTRS